MKNNVIYYVTHRHGIDKRLDAVVVSPAEATWSSLRSSVFRGMACWKYTIMNDLWTCLQFHDILLNNKKVGHVELDSPYW
jgi:hypothetical protein